MAIRYNSGAAREATGLKQMPIRARTHKTGAGGMSASLIGHSGSSAFRLTTTTVLSMSLTGSCFSSESAPGALVSWDSRTRGNNLFTPRPAHRRANSVFFCDRRPFLTDKPNYISIELDRLLVIRAVNDSAAI